MTRTLKALIQQEESPKNVDIEIQEFLGDSLDKVLKKYNIDFSDEEINEFVYNLRSKINYQEATDEDIINFYEALAKILK